MVRAQGLAPPPLHSLPVATGILTSAFRLWSNPFPRVLSLTALKTKKTPNRELFCFGTRTGIGSAATALIACGNRHTHVCLSLVVEPFSQGSLPYRAKNKKNSRLGAFLFWYAHRDWLRRHGAHSLMLTGVLKSAFRLWSNPFLRVLSLTALKTKKTPVWELFCFGTRTGIGFAATALIR